MFTDHMMWRTFHFITLWLFSSVFKVFIMWLLRGLEIFSLGKIKILVCSPVRELAEKWKRENGGWVDLDRAVLLFGSDFFHPRERTKRNIRFQLNPAWKLEFLPHLKIAHATAAWLNWVPSEGQRRRGTDAVSWELSTAEAAKAPWDAAASSHMK